MIRNRLSELLSERGLKTSRVAKEVSIARSSLTSMIQNENEMIRLDAIDKLCNYLNIDVADFFEFSPLVIDFTLTKPEIIMSVHHTTSTHLKEMLSFLVLDCDFLIDININNDKLVFDCEITFSEMKFERGRDVLVFEIKDEDSQKKLKSIINTLTPGLKNMVYKEINKKLATNFKGAIHNAAYDQLFFPEFTSDEYELVLSRIKEANFKIKSSIFREY
ncbi:transcriptional regulator [Staphylococcus epidermidis]|uniref:helix-turn-helix domain-containing protein n=1 Tax=Staphylococcus epidermidis TaxID=1282 RepID=UPI000C16F866|nr:helix-turn-helix transcriptional regulator [Staphylococcus epidermidis]ATQ50755.1 transcriptional regulator [Staphylococcus epidermidis]